MFQRGAIKFDVEVRKNNILAMENQCCNGALESIYVCLQERIALIKNVECTGLQAGLSVHAALALSDTGMPQ